MDDVSVSRSRVIGSKVELAVPVDMEPVALQGIDSEVGMFRGEALELSYDFGAYSDPLTNVPADAQVETFDVAGRSARRVSFALPDEPDWAHVVAAHVPGIDDNAPGNQERKLTVTVRCKSVDDAVAAHMIIDSITILE